MTIGDNFAYVSEARCGGGMIYRIWDKLEKGNLGLKLGRSWIGLFQLGDGFELWILVLASPLP